MAALENEDGTADLVGVATFIDDLVRTEKHLLRARQMERRNREWKTIARRVRHLLGNHIYSLSMDLTNINEFGSEDRLRMKTAIEDSKQLLDEFRKLGQARIIDRKPANLLDIVRAGLTPVVSDSVAIFVNERPIAQCRRHSPEFDICVDERKIRECFSELAANSKHWAKPNQTLVITVSLAVHNRYPHGLEINASKNTRTLHVSFCDNGVGIAKKHKRRIFEAFFTQRQEGTGDGLAIVKEVIEAHGGGIDERGVHGEGARFEIKLPVIPTSKPKQQRGDNNGKDPGS